MKTELELVRMQARVLGMPVRDKPEQRVGAEEMVSRRRLLRVETEDFLNGGLWADDLVEMSIRLVRLAFVTAGTLAQFGLEPDLRDFAEAVTGLVKDMRANLDGALRVNDWTSVKIETAKLEIIWYGIAASLGLPYVDLLNLLHQKYMAGVEVDKDDVRDLLARAGLPVQPRKA